MTPENLADAVRAAERARAAAVVARDLVALQACLHDDLVYVHATGHRHGKDELLRYVHQGPEFLAVDFQAGPMAEYGAAVLMHGQLHLRLRRPGEAGVVDLQSWASAMWLRDARGHWQLRLFQSTRCAA